MEDFKVNYLKTEYKRIWFPRTCSNCADVAKRFVWRVTMKVDHRLSFGLPGTSKTLRFNFCYRCALQERKATSLGFQLLREIHDGKRKY